MNTRTLNERQTIEAIAEYYMAAKESCLEFGIGGDGGHVPRMGSTYREGTFEEFEWCLGVMHHKGRQYAYMGESWRTLRAHIVMYWINVERVQRHTTERVPTGKGRKKKSLLLPKTYVDVIRHRDANAQKAGWGIDVVQTIWPRQKRLPWLPEEVFQTALDNRVAA